LAGCAAAAFDHIVGEGKMPPLHTLQLSYRPRHRVPQVLKVTGWALGAWLLVGGLFWAVRALL
jgi:hypothetical protein